MEEPVPDDSALLKPKPKREQTDKQKAVWAKAQQTRLAKRILKFVITISAKNPKKLTLNITPAIPFSTYFLFFFI